MNFFTTNVSWSIGGGSTRAFGKYELACSTWRRILGHNAGKWTASRRCEYEGEPWRWWFWQTGSRTVRRRRRGKVGGKSSFHARCRFLDAKKSPSGRVRPRKKKKTTIMIRSSVDNRKKWMCTQGEVTSNISSSSLSRYFTWKLGIGAWKGRLRIPMKEFWIHMDIKAISNENRGRKHQSERQKTDGQGRSAKNLKNQSKCQFLHLPVFVNLPSYDDLELANLAEGTTQAKQQST